VGFNGTIPKIPKPPRIRRRFNTRQTKRNQRNVDYVWYSLVKLLFKFEYNFNQGG